MLFPGCWVMILLRKFVKDKMAPEMRIDLRLGTGMLRMNFYIQGKMKTPPVTLIRIELHSLGLGVSISPLVALVNVEWHSLGLATVEIFRLFGSSGR